MLRADVAYELLDDNRLPHAGTAVGPDLSATGERRDEVEHFNARFEHVNRRGLLVKCGRLAVDRPVILGLDLFQVVERLTERVEQAAKRGLTDGHRYRRARVDGLGSALKSIRFAKGKTADPVVADVLLHFEHQAATFELAVQRVVDRRHLLRRKLNVHHRTDHLRNRSCRHQVLPAKYALRAS